MRIIVLLLWAFYQHPLLRITPVNATDGADPVSENDCTKYPNETALAYIGWPFIPTCYDILDSLADYHGPLYIQNRQINSTCKLFYANGTTAGVVTATPRTLRKKSNSLYLDKFPTFIAQDGINRSFKFELTVPNGNFCASMNLNMKTEIDPTSGKECKNIRDEVAYHDQKFVVKTSVTLSCKGLQESTLYFPIEDSTFEWWYNCNKSLPNNTILNGTELTIRSVDFSNPGEYLCAVKRGGKRRFLAKHKVCVQYTNNAIYSIKCQDVKAQLGETVDVLCFVNAGTANDTLEGHFKAKWLKAADGNAEDVCSATSKSLRDQLFGKEPDSRVKCDVFWKNRTDTCYDKVTSPDKVTPSFQTLRIKLRIKNLQAREAGQYYMIFQTFSSDVLNTTVTLSIAKDDESKTITLIVALVVVILVLLIIIILLLCFCKKIHVLWCCKKNCGSYEKGNKPYVAYLSYHYSNAGMEERSGNLTQGLVSSLNEFMRDVGAKMYNDHKDKGNLRPEVEDIIKARKECHRIIIIMNAEYIRKEWDRHKEYLTSQDNSTEKAKIIFILMPGVKKNIKVLSDELKTALIHTMQMNTTIAWDGKIPLGSNFRHHLQYSLPKLKNNSNSIEPVADPLIQEEHVV